jgi:hypothetical protein
MTSSTATWPLGSLPSRISRPLAIVVVAIAAFALVALAFAIGRWTAGGSTPAPTGGVTPAVVQHAPLLTCHLHGPC